MGVRPWLALSSALVLLVASCSDGGGSPESQPLVRFAGAGDVCESTWTLYIDDESFDPVFCGEDEDNYSGPLFPSDIEAILAGAGELYEAGHPEFEWSSDDARQRWRDAVEAAAERIAGPRIAKRKACPGEVPEVSLSVSAGNKTWPVTVELSPGPGSVTLTWQVRLELLEGPVMGGVSAETKAQVAQVRAGFTERGLRAVTIDVPPSGTASETFVVTRSPLFVSGVGGQYATVWINAETQCGSIASTGSFALPPV